MTTRVSAALLLVVLAVPPVRAQVEPAPAAATTAPAEENVDSDETGTGEAVLTSTTTTKVTVSTTSPDGSNSPASSPPPPWIHFVRFAAVAGPIAVLLLAWMVGVFAHHRIVRREQALFPAIRGSRSPQTTPMFLTAVLFFIPLLLFAYFEIRSRHEMRLGLAGIVDEWLPVRGQAWATFVVCLVLALLPWLFARRADTVS